MGLLLSVIRHAMLRCTLLQAGEAAITEASAASRTLVAESYLPPNPGPYPQDKPPENQVRFTPVQVRTPHLSLWCLLPLQGHNEAQYPIPGQLHAFAALLFAKEP